MRIYQSRWLFGLSVISLLVSGCTTFPRGVPANVTMAYASPDTTLLGRQLAAVEKLHPGQSAFHILDFGLESLVARVTLADTAERTIDAQYYIYDSDEAGSLLAEHLLKAADRGVRVRLLLDDYNLGSDHELAALCAHPNIQVRVFNPIRCRLRLFRLPAYALHLHQADRRMHNKLFIADNVGSILGGRNVGNDYFGIRTTDSFRDFDVLMEGPVTRQASAAFDEYWNSQWSVPATELVDRRPTGADLEAERCLVHARVKGAAGFEEKFAAMHDKYLTTMTAAGSPLIWGEGEIVSDLPRKVDDASARSSAVAERFDEELRRARSEILIEAAYFVPGTAMVQECQTLHQRGVSIRLLTSALEATDVPIVFCAYQKYRRDLLAVGVDLYEFKVHRGLNPRGERWYRLRPSYGALHSKVIVFDRELSWIGSFNLDPRSANLNTEIAVLVQSRALANQLADTITADLSPTRSWHVRRQPRVGPDSHKVDDASLVWDGEVNGRPVELRHEPANWARRMEAFFLSLAPGVESQL